MYNPCNFPTSCRLLLSEERKRKVQTLEMSQLKVCFDLFTLHTHASALFHALHVLSLCCRKIVAHYQFALRFWNSSTALAHHRGVNHLCLKAGVRACCVLNQDTRKCWHKQSEDNMWRHNVEKVSYREGCSLAASRSTHLASTRLTSPPLWSKSPLQHMWASEAAARIVG